jgi:N-methylhydantoinase B
MVTGVKAVKGEVFRLISGTGGGYGDPKRRDRTKLLRDVRDGFVTPEQARRDYGVELPLARK